MSSRGYAATSDGCRSINHPACFGCGATIYRRSAHIHIFRVGPTREELLCSACWEATCIAAIPIMQVAEESGIGVTPEALHAAIANGWLLVLRQLVLPLVVEP